MSEALRGGRAPAGQAGIIERHVRTFLGLDLGQAHDYTAIAVLEKFVRTRQVTRIVRDYRGIDEPRIELETFPARYALRHLERPRLGTSYPAVVERVRALLATPQLRGKTSLVLDYTGVGRPVFDMFRREGLERVPILLHGGVSVTREGGAWRVPKRDLVGALLVLFGEGRLDISRRMPEAPTLVRELENFKMKINPVTSSDSYSAWREQDNDDLVLATACAAWYGERWQPEEPSQTVFWRSFGR
jgi:hypothetical protein